MDAYRESLTALLPLLRCPACRSAELLELRAGAVDAGITEELCDEHLCCSDCNAQYPITHDYIPIMWDNDLRSVYSDIEQSECNSASTLDANIEIYDSISDNYNKFTRQHPPLAQRMKNGVRRILDQRKQAEDFDRSAPIYHVDFGCGPGHVMGWLKEFGLHHVGVDVSIKNLRNAREFTGCLIVCGNACNMPFADAAIDIVTESSVLHHIFDWKAALRESLRICKPMGGIVLDSEPSQEQMAWSPLAVMVYNLRFPAYRVLSYVKRDKYIFRDTAQAKRNLEAEIHHQPGTGFPVEEVEAMFEDAGFSVNCVLSPTPDLQSKAIPNWKGIVLNLLSARNPWNAKYGEFTTVGVRNRARAA